uniref:Pecanex-like protein n=1 Tax=Angiostrongylus cantonensis TaxID=6313 RepID=A0A0K0DFV3_ANGCA
LCMYICQRQSEFCPITVSQASLHIPCFYERTPDHIPTSFMNFSNFIKPTKCSFSQMFIASSWLEERASQLSNKYLQNIPMQLPLKASLASINSIFLSSTDLDFLRSVAFRFQHGLKTNIFPCRSLYDVYEYAGFVLCKAISDPAQGMWAAAGALCKVFVNKNVYSIYVLTSSSSSKPTIRVNGPQSFVFSIWRRLRIESHFL